MSCSKNHYRLSMHIYCHLRHISMNQLLWYIYCHLRWHISPWINYFDTCIVIWDTFPWINYSDTLLSFKISHISMNRLLWYIYCYLRWYISMNQLLRYIYCSLVLWIKPVHTPLWMLKEQPFMINNKDRYKTRTYTCATIIKQKSGVLY